MHRMWTKEARWWLVDNINIVSFDYALSITERWTKETGKSCEDFPVLFFLSCKISWLSLCKVREDHK